MSIDDSIRSKVSEFTKGCCNDEDVVVAEVFMAVGMSLFKSEPLVAGLLYAPSLFG